MDLQEAQKKVNELEAERTHLYNKLHFVVERHEATIHKRWAKKNVEQRKEILKRAWPQINVKHRPDWALLWDLPDQEDSEADDAEQRSTEHEQIKGDNRHIEHQKVFEQEGPTKPEAVECPELNREQTPVKHATTSEQRKSIEHDEVKDSQSQDGEQATANHDANLGADDTAEDPATDRDEKSTDSDHAPEDLATLPEASSTGAGDHSKRSVGTHKPSGSQTWNAGTITVEGSMVIRGDVQIKGILTVEGSVRIDGNVSIQNTLTKQVCGKTQDDLGFTYTRLEDFETVEQRELVGMQKSVLDEVSKASEEIEIAKDIDTHMEAVEHQGNTESQVVDENQEADHHQDLDGDRGDVSKHVSSVYTPTVSEKSSSDKQDSLTKQDAIKDQDGTYHQDSNSDASAFELLTITGYGLLGNNTWSRTVSREVALIAFMWPYLNLEDLSGPRAFLLLLKSRGRNHPNMFAEHDVISSRLAITTGAFQPLNTPRISVSMHDGTTNVNHASKGSNVNEGRGETPEIKDAAELGAPAALKETFAFLKVQTHLIKFLLEACEELLHDVSEEAISSGEIQPEPSLSPSAESTWATVSMLRSEAPYSPPSRSNLDHLINLARARAKRAEYHLSDLKHDPEYFIRSAKDVYQHRPEHLTQQDSYGGRHPAFTSKRRNAYMWSQVLLTLMSNAYGSAGMWRTVWDLLQQLVAAQGDVSTQRQIFANLFFLLDFVLQKLPTSLYQCGVFGAPAFRQKAFARANSLIMKPVFGNNRDRLLEYLWILTDPVIAFRLGPINVINEIQRLLDIEPATRARLTPWLSSMFEEYAFVAELLHPLCSLFPWAPELLKSAEPYYGVPSFRRQALTASYTIGNDVLHDLTLGQADFDVTNEFKYPADKKRVEETEELMKRARENLSAFWKPINKRFHDFNIGNLHQILSFPRDPVTSSNTMIATRHMLVSNLEDLERTEFAEPSGPEHEAKSLDPISKTVPQDSEQDRNAQKNPSPNVPHVTEQENHYQDKNYTDTTSSEAGSHDSRDASKGSRGQPSDTSVSEVASVLSKTAEAQEGVLDWAEEAEAEAIAREIENSVRADCPIDASATETDPQISEEEPETTQTNPREAPDNNGDSQNAKSQIQDPEPSSMVIQTNEADKAPSKEVTKPQNVPDSTGNPSQHSDAEQVPLGKRHFKFFANLFYDPFERDAPAELKWADFLAAMSELEFKVEKLYGHVWSFTKKTPRDSHSIHFHEPHPDSKLTPWQARAISRRLTAVFGWSGKTFVRK